MLEKSKESLKQTSLDISKIRKSGHFSYQFLEKKEVQKISQNIIKIIHDQAFKEFIWIDAFGGDHRLFGLENILPEIAELKKNLDGVLTELYDAPIESTFLSQHVVASAGNKGSGGAFHRDSQRAQYKAFLYLTDTDVETGALQLVNDSHKLLSKVIDCVSQKRLRLDITKPTLDPRKNISTLSVKAGDVLLCDTSCIHRGSPGIKSDRVNLTLYAYADGKMPAHIRKMVYKKGEALDS